MSKVRLPRRKYKKSFFSRTRLFFSVSLIICCGAFGWVFYEIMYTKASEDWFETKMVASQAVSLPKDDAPHQAAMEWWYYNGHLKSESGKQYSFHHTVFLVNNVVSHTVSHASLNDLQSGEHYTAQRRTAGNSSVNTENRFEFIQGDWSMLGGDGNDSLKITTNAFGFDLGLTSTQEPVLHGGNGIISLGVAGSSYYYSRTRMAASGTITIGDKTEKVSGISWFDHQWGDFSVGLLSWDWFSLQLNNGVDVMIYQLRDKANRPVLFTGSISHNGVTELLPETDFSIVPGKTWTSSKSNIVYPIEWAINIPKRNINLTVEGINKNSEFDAMLTSYNFYWEGAVKIQGSHTGVGFMELYYMDKKH